MTDMHNELEEANNSLRQAIQTRIKNRGEGKSFEDWYTETASAIAEVATDGAAAAGSEAFLRVIDEIKAVHIKKSHDYGEPKDPLANIRNGAEIVGIEPWRGCVIRIADKMQRIRSYCREGKLANEGFEDALLDLASYAIIALVMFREGNRDC